MWYGNNRIIVKKEQVCAKNGWAMLTHMDEQENGSTLRPHHWCHNFLLLSFWNFIQSERNGISYRWLDICPSHGM